MSHQQPQRGGFHSSGPPGTERSAQIMGGRILLIDNVDNDVGFYTNRRDNTAGTSRRHLAFGAAAMQSKHITFPFARRYLKNEISEVRRHR